MKSGHAENGALEPTARAHTNECLTFSLISLRLSRLAIGAGVAITFLFGLCSVLLASVLSGKTRKKYFWGYRKNLCARILNGFVSDLLGFTSLVRCSFGPFSSY